MYNKKILDLNNSVMRALSTPAIEHENAFYWSSSPNRLGKLLAQYELYKKIINLPGEVIETGIFKGSSLIRFATFRSFFETAEARKIYAFDMLGKFPQRKYSMKVDLEYAMQYDNAFGVGLSEKELLDILCRKKIQDNIHFIQGDIIESMPSFFNSNKLISLSFVHVDVETYEPTAVILEQCWHRIVPGGVLLLDDFNGTTGSSKAIFEFFANQNVKYQKFPFADAPTYIIK